jgi:hypothetical protein
MRMTQAQFIERFGNPAKFTFRGQCYDTRVMSTPCVCARNIRFCFIVYSGIGEKITVGSCCFKCFAGTRLVDILEASQIYLLNNVVETQRAEKIAAEKQKLVDSRKLWLKVRREAISRVKAHQKASGKDWLPEPLFDLKTATASPEPLYRRSSQAAKWFLAKAEYLRKRLAEADRVSGTMGHEATADHKS